MNKEKIKNIIENMFKHSGCMLSKCDFSEDNGIIWCLIETPDSSFLIGRDGETLKSINHIVNRLIEKDNLETGERNNIFIDINGYQKKRFENLKNIAHMMAERARYFKSNIEIDPMPASERKIIHMFLENYKDIKTESEGFGSNRRIIIKYINDENI